MPKLMVPDIENKIFLIRGRRVMLDTDLAAVYRVPTKVLNRAAKCNAKRFPEDFMFRPTIEEAENLRSQFVTSSKNSVLNLRYQFGTSSSAHGGRRYLPYAFTEHGAVMLASVLNSPMGF